MKLVFTCLTATEQLTQDFPSIACMVGLGQQLKSIYHANLCSYLDFIPVAPNKVLAVSEHYEISLESLLTSGPFDNLEFLTEGKVWANLLGCLGYLHDYGVAHRTLCPENIQFEYDGTNNTDPELKLFGFGSYFLSENGKFIGFNGNPSIMYFAPEVWLLGDTKNSVFHSKADVWAVGLIALEVICSVKEKKRVYCFENEKECFKFYEWMFNSEQHPQVLLEEFLKPFYDKVESETALSFVKSCLVFNPCARNETKEILKHCPFFTNTGNIYSPSFPTSVFNPKFMSLSMKADSLLDLPSPQLYHIWKVSGGDVAKEFVLQRLRYVKDDYTSLSIHLFPRSIKFNGSLHYNEGVDLTSNNILNGLIFDIDIEKLGEELKHKLLGQNIRQEATNENPSANKNFCPFKPVWEKNELYDEKLGAEFSEKYLESVLRSLNLPRINYIVNSNFKNQSEKEKNAAYQYVRIKIFSSLLSAYPASMDVVRKESLIDIPPFCRGATWACLLGVQEGDKRKYKRMDKEKEHDIDKQIEVDLPRCHQYHPLMRNPQGLLKMKRLLKAWVLTSEKLVYWQGLDSICAAFLVNNYDDEATAFVSFSIFIKRFLPTFFQEDNTATIQAFLHLFRQVISFHDPELNSHLTEIGFLPDLYAIPWFLTFFTHVFSLKQIPQIWDKLLALPPSSHDHILLILICFALLQLMRSSLLNSTFNECAHVFSDVANVDVSGCVEKAINLLYNTPPSFFNPLNEIAQTNSKGLTTFGDPGNSPTAMTVLTKHNNVPIVSKSDLHWLLTNFKENVTVILDVRPVNDFQKHHIIRSWCLFPSLTEVNDEDSTPEKNFLNDLEKVLVADVPARFVGIKEAVNPEPQYYTIVGSKNSSKSFEQSVARELLRLKIKGVMVLHEDALEGIKSDLDAFEASLPTCSCECTNLTSSKGQTLKKCKAQ